ncbi:MAG: sulfite exporter TauE/SafE family protein [Rhodospirillales bacterium]|nr:sulfite exporter TauE/SafE family protein [Rhodospirillales bacterium]
MIGAPAVLYVASGFTVGFLVGLTGVGGGSLMTPVLVLGFGIHPAAAVGTDLLFAAATKSVGTAMHGLVRTVRWRITARLALGSVPAAALTLLALSRIDMHGPHVERLISVTLGLALILSAVSLLLRRHVVARVGAWTSLTPTRVRRLTVLTGAVVGALVSVSSVGAGALGMTALVLLYPREPVQRLVGADIAHAVPLTLLAGIGHWLLGDVRWPLFGLLLAGSVPGVLLGSLLAARVPDRVLRPLLAAVLVLAGLRMAMAVLE